MCPHGARRFLTVAPSGSLGAMSRLLTLLAAAAVIVHPVSAIAPAPHAVLAPDVGSVSEGVSAPVRRSTPAAVAEDNWPQWRGPGGLGIAEGAYVDTWSATENIARKTEMPGRGHS